MDLLGIISGACVGLFFCWFLGIAVSSTGTAYRYYKHQLERGEVRVSDILDEVGSDIFRSLLAIAVLLYFIYVASLRWGLI